MAPTTIRALIGATPAKPTLNDSVLLIIDAQNEYVSGLLKITSVETSLPVIKAVLQRYREANGSIIHVVHDVPKGAPIFTPDTPLAEIVDELKPQGNEPIVHKTEASAFTRTDLQEYLDKIGKKQLVLVGYMAHNCITATARIAAELGYEVSAIKDAIGDRELPGATADELVRGTLAAIADTVGTVIESKDLA